MVWPINGRELQSSGGNLRGVAYRSQSRLLAFQRQQLLSNRARIILQLQQVPLVAVQVFENCDRSVRFLARFLVELYSSRFHFTIVAPKIVGVQKKKDSSSGLDGGDLAAIARFGRRVRSQ